MTLQYMHTNDVKDTLRKIGPKKVFQVTFVKKDGNFRTIFGYMDIFKGDANEDFGKAVPVVEESTGQFRSFSLDSVLEINW